MAVVRLLCSEVPCVRCFWWAFLLLLSGASFGAFEFNLVVLLAFVNISYHSKKKIKIALEKGGGELRQMEHVYMHTRIPPTDIYSEGAKEEINKEFPWDKKVNPKLQSAS